MSGRTTTMLETLECFLRGDHAVVACVNEADFYRLWSARGLGELSPCAAAVAGGLIADRLAWVFTAGYQATLRNAFAGLKSGGWAAFAATEDVHDPRSHPGTRLSERGRQLRLDGHKSWVAHSRFLDYLIVTVNDPGGDKRRARGIIIERTRPGLTLTHREEPGFLGAMSQGFAQFESTPIDPAEVFEFEPIRQFGRTEAKFVMLAASAFMLAHSREEELSDRLFAVIGALGSLIAQTDTSRQVYGRIDNAYIACVDRFEQTAAIDNIPDYAADRRLFRLYTDRIQRRAGYARAGTQAPHGQRNGA